MREILSHLGEATSPLPVAPARGQSLWEMAEAEQGEFDPQPQPLPVCEFDQQIAWQKPDEDDPIGLVRDRLRQGSPRRPRRPPRRPMVILAL